MLKAFLAISTYLAAADAFAAGVGVEFVNWYGRILHAVGLDDHTAHVWQPVLAGCVTLAVLTIIGVAFRKHCTAQMTGEVIPSGRISFSGFVELVMDFVLNLAKDIIGAGARPFIPLLVTIFVFIFVSNLSGLIPGFPPATESIDTNFAIAICVFVVYNLAGLKEHKHHYIKQFLGPLAALAPLLFLIESISHVARPISLSLRLYGNIFGDHLVLSVFSVVPIIPAALLFFGLLVASIQSFVFTLLSSIYISMAISHDH